MKGKQHSSGGTGDNESRDKALWDLLGNARTVEASPMFSRNVLREIRLSSEKTSAWQGIFAAFRKPVFLFATAAVLLISGHFIIQNQSESVPGTTEIAEVDSLEYIDPATEFESIEMLGELMAVSDPGSLSDEALMNLLF